MKNSFWVGFAAGLIITVPTICVLFYWFDQLYRLG